MTIISDKKYVSSWMYNLVFMLFKFSLLKKEPIIGEWNWVTEMLY